jgi:cell division protein FtsB
MSRLSISLRRQSLSLMLGAVLSALLLNCLFGPSGPSDLLILRSSEQVLTKDRDRLLSENACFRERIARLKSDDAYLQQLIRQELGYVRPGEIVYRFPQSEQH